MSNPEKQQGFCSKFSNLLSCRQALSLMTMMGFMLNYALRVNLTIAIVAMVKPADHNSTIGNKTEADDLDDGLFNWDAHQQNFVLGTFFWGYILTELPGGRLAELIGGRRVFGHAMLWASLLTFLTPFAAKLDYIALIVVRVVLGFMLGASWPAIHPVAAVWIPPMERSKFIANSMASSLGAAVTMPICGYLISISGWESVFYVTGAVGLLWSFCWFSFTYETPAVHPRITIEERKEIEEAIGSSTSKKRPSYVPWASLFTSSAVWALIITHALSVFGFFTVIHQLPTYMHDILNFNIKENGLFSALPYLAKYIMAMLASYLADHLRQKGTLSTTATRKIFTGFALTGPGLLMIAQVFFGSNAGASVAILTLSLFCHGAITGGYLSNGLDIAPNFAGTIFGMANTLSSFGGFLSTWMVGTLTYENNKDYHQWQIVFWILAGTYISAAAVFAIFGTGKMQPWNNPPEKARVSDIAAEEGAPLTNGTKITN